jgi:diguanylate cyclase (GGDEF)-like protein
MSRPARIFLASRDDERKRLWSEALRSARCQVVSSNGELLDEVDVVVIDHPLSEAQLPLDEERLTLGQTGVVAVGVGIPADVALPVDHSARELRLACLLLAEIVRLRRQREASRRQERVLTHLALSDPLTGLPNRRAWEQELAQRIGTTGDQRTWCIALLDVDHFHEINDRLGHLEGDAALRRVADRLAQAVRRGGFVARLGGDEFAVLLPDIDATQAPALIDLIRNRCAEEENPASARPGLRLSAGWATLTAPATRTDVQEALARADEALRQAKQAGRDRTLPPVPATV